MVVTVVSALDLLEGLAAVDALEQTHGRAIHDVGILGIDREGGEIPGPLAEVVLAIDQGPLLAAVVAAVKAALLGLNERVDAIRVAGRHGNADPAPVAIGQAVFLELLPGIAAVDGNVQ